MRNSPSHGATLWYLNKKKLKQKLLYKKKRLRDWGRGRWTCVKRGAVRKYRGARKEREAGGIYRECGRKQRVQHCIYSKSYIAQKSVSINSGPDSMSCIVSLLVIASANPVKWWWILLCSTAFGIPKPHTAGKFTGRDFTSGSGNPYSAVPSYWSLIGRLD